MTAPDRCPRCNSSAWWFDREDQAVTAVCLMCAERIFIRDDRAEACGRTDESKGYEWANQSGAYNDPYDFKRMCTSCHRTLDAARRRETGERTSPRRGGDAKCPQTD